MKTREQIIEIAKREIIIINTSCFDDNGMALTKQSLGNLENFADAILALPLDIPSDRQLTIPRVVCLVRLN